MKIEKMQKKLALIILSTATLGVSIMIGIDPVLSQTRCSGPDCLFPPPSPSPDPDPALNPCHSNPESSKCVDFCFMFPEKCR